MRYLNALVSLVGFAAAGWLIVASHVAFYHVEPIHFWRLLALENLIGNAFLIVHVVRKQWKVPQPKTSRCYTLPDGWDALDFLTYELLDELHTQKYDVAVMTNGGKIRNLYDIERREISFRDNYEYMTEQGFETLMDWLREYHFIAFRIAQPLEKTP